MRRAPCRRRLAQPAREQRQRDADVHQRTRHPHDQPAELLVFERRQRARRQEPVVERRVNNDLGAAIMWVDGVRSWESVQALPKPATWGFQLARMKMFDDLISNSDRNKGNLIVDDDWHIYLIDHSRAFVTDVKLPQELQNVDRKLWDRMLALDQAGLEASMGKWLDTRQIGSLLKRRDAMKKKIDALVKQRGDTVFF